MNDRRGRSAERRLATLAAAGAGALAVYLAYRSRRARRPLVIPPGERIEEAFADRTATVDGIRMRWLEHGHGHPVVLLHGIPTSPDLWRRVMPRLRGAHAFAWELVGYGASIPEGAGRDISVARQAEYLAAWLRRMGLRDVVLAGHDLGGGVAQILAVRHPELCAGLLLANAIGYDSWPVPAARALQATAGVVEHLPAGAIRLGQELLFHLGHDDARVRRESARLHWRHYARHDAADALTRQARSLDVRDTLEIQDRLPHLDVPARVVWGAADGFLEVRYGERFARDLGTRLQRIEGGKHFTPEDHPEEIARALNDLVREVGSNGGRAPIGP